MKKIICLLLTLVMAFSFFSFTAFAQEGVSDEDYGVAPCYTYAAICESYLVCSGMKATMTASVQAVSSVNKITIEGDLLKYTSDGWKSVYTFSKVFNSVSYASVEYTKVISPFADYCLKTIVTLTTSTQAEIITMYRYS